MKIKTNVDKCELFGVTPMHLIKDVENVRIGDVWNKEGYRLMAVNTDGDTTSTQTNTTVTFAILMDDVCLARITFKNSRKFYGVWTMRVSNRTFYSSTLYPNGLYGYKYSDFDFIPIIINDLGLTLMTVRKLEIDVDVNVKAGKRLRDIRKNTKDYDLILHGRKVGENARLNGCGLWFEYSRNNLCNHPTEYIRNAKGLSVKTYSKRDEISNSNKDYIADWNGWNGKMWRSEVTTKNPDILRWIEYTKNQDYTLKTFDLMQFLHFLSIPAYRLAFWRYQSQRLIRYNRKRDNRKVDMYDVIIGKI